MESWRLKGQEKVEGPGRRDGEALNKDAGMEHSSCAGVPLLSAGTGTTSSPDMAVAQLREAPSIDSSKPSSPSPPPYPNDHFTYS